MRKVGDDRDGRADERIYRSGERGDFNDPEYEHFETLSMLKIVSYLRHNPQIEVIDPGISNDLVTEPTHVDGKKS